jgi:hypothetical protein
VLALAITTLAITISGITWHIATANGNYTSATKARTGPLITLARTRITWLNRLIALGEQI